MSDVKPLQISATQMRRRIGRIWLPDGLHIWWKARGVHLYWSSWPFITFERCDNWDAS